MPDPQTTRAKGDANWVQGVLLAMIPAMVVMTMITVIPIIPKLSVVFAKTPDKSVLVPMIVVLPILAIAFSSIAAGMLGERVGRRRLLEISTALFAVSAIMPFWLDSIPAILLTRAVAGIALGAMATSGVGLTGDYFSGASRQRWLAIQGGAAAAAGVMTSAIAGALGDISWRLPFLLLAAGFPLFLALILLPARHASHPDTQHREEEAEQRATGQISWAALAAIFALGTSASLIIFPPAYELGLVLQERKLGSSTLAGLATAVLAAGSIAGAMGLMFLRRLSAPGKVAMAFAVSGAGMLLVSSASGIAMIMVGAIAVGIGQGMVGPVLSGWLLDRTPAPARGRMVGIFNTIFWSAQFAGPLIAGWIAARSASTASSLVYYELASAAAAACVIVGWARQPGRLGLFTPSGREPSLYTNADHRAP